MKRCNLEETDTGIRLCRGAHDKSAPCEWEYFVPLNSISAEREACARVCEGYENGRHANLADLCAEAIRMRPNVYQTERAV